ncbi:Hypothetical predicted protein [Mytilus galloprovincialis]|uniref:Uncharacterized protein n=1 Tax=Mytilus galloprovincialis TaxID=29158 RepID=A0A8B6BX02_MYTGA|nr:Hypothetical predicted protein [Mytilus galloprovincialis]
MTSSELLEIVWSDESLNSVSPDHDHLSFYESPAASPYISHHYGTMSSYFKQPYMDHHFPELSKPYQNMWKLVSKRELSHIITRLRRSTLSSRTRQKRPQSEHIGDHVKQEEQRKLCMTPNGPKEFRSFR